MLYFFFTGSYFTHICTSYMSTLPISTLCVVDPFSTGALFCHTVMNTTKIKVYRLMSQSYSEQQLNFVPPGLHLPFTGTLCYLDFGSVEEMANALKELGVEGVFPGCEPAVELSDSLNEALGVRGNSVKYSPHRRDKFLMQEALKEAGLRSIKQIRIDCNTEFIDIENFTASLPLEFDGKFSAVFKPSRSCGTDGVTFVQTNQEIKIAHEAIIGHQNQLGLTNQCAVLQEFIRGVEYVVDSVSLHGVHKAVAVWEYQKLAANGSKFVYSGMRLVPSSSDPSSIFQVIIAYVNKSLGLFFVVSMFC